MPNSKSQKSKKICQRAVNTIRQCLLMLPADILNICLEYENPMTLSFCIFVDDAHENRIEHLTHTKHNMYTLHNGYIHYPFISLFCKYKNDSNNIWKCCFRDKSVYALHLNNCDPPYRLIIDDSCVLHMNRVNCEWNISSIELNPKIEFKTMPLKIREANLFKQRNV